MRVFTFLLLFLGLLIIKFPYLSSPAFWDESVRYVQPVLRLHDDFRLIYQDPSIFWYHPPLGFLVYYATTLLLGVEIIIFRITALFFFSIFVFFSFKNTIYLFNKTTAFGVLICMVSLAHTYTISTRYTGDMFFCALVSLYLYSYLKKNYQRSFFWGILIGLTRETGIAYGASLLFYGLLTKRSLKSTILTSSSPFISIIFFYSLQKISTGFFLNHEALQHDFMLNFSYRIFMDILYDVFLSQNKGRIFFVSLFFVVIIFLLSIFKNKANIQLVERKWASVLFSIFCILSFVIPLTFNQGVLPRYFLSLVPFVFSIYIYPLSLLMKRQVCWLFFIIFSLNLISYHPVFEGGEIPNRHGPSVTTMAHQESVKSIIAAKEYIDSNLKIQSYCSHWPIEEYFKDSRLGYSGPEYTLVDCLRFGKGFQHYFIGHSTADVYILSSVLVTEGQLRSLEKSEGLKLIKSIETKNVITNIYRK